MKYAVAGGVLLLLSSCARAEERTAGMPNDYHLYKSQAGYAVGVPFGFSYAELAPFGKYFYFGYSANSHYARMSIEFYDAVLSSCSGSLLGASHMQPLAQTQGSWGEVDFYSQYGSEEGLIDYEGERPLCAKPSSAHFRYAFCSEKNNSTIVICILQVKDNRDIARQIFETFRWLQ